MMNVAVLGSGDVGRHLTKGFLARGDSVCIGSRTPRVVREWIESEALQAEAAEPAEAAGGAELLVLATNWAGAPTTAEQIRSEAAGKILIDVTNPLGPGGAGGAPKLMVGYPDSGGKGVQAMLPESKVVKCFNTVNARFMVNPGFSGGPGDMFLCGNDESAKSAVAALCREWGWVPQDMGSIEESYLLEALAMAWIVYAFRTNHWEHGFAFLNRAPE